MLQRTCCNNHHTPMPICSSTTLGICALISFIAIAIFINCFVTGTIPPAASYAALSLSSLASLITITLFCISLISSEGKYKMLPEDREIGNTLISFLQDEVPCLDEYKHIYIIIGPKSKNESGNALLFGKVNGSLFGSRAPNSLVIIIPKFGGEYVGAYNNNDSTNLIVTGVYADFLSLKNGERPDFLMEKLMQNFKAY